MIKRFLDILGATIGRIVEAAETLKKAHPDVRCLLLEPVDNGSWSVVSCDQIDAWQKEGTVRYLRGTTNIRYHLAVAHRIGLPSCRCNGNPRVLLEAAASGRPAITTDMPGCRDTVIPDVSGFLCPPRDVDALLLQMERFIKLTTGARAQMGVAARELAENRFDERLVIDAYLQQLPHPCGE